MTIPAWVLVIGAFWSLAGWVLFAWAFRLWPVAGLGIPFCGALVIYAWFTLVDVPINVRADWVRAVLLTIVFSQGPVLSVLAFFKKRVEKTRK